MIAGIRNVNLNYTYLVMERINIRNRNLAKNIRSCPEWHPGDGGKAWLFVDEVIVE